MLLNQPADNASKAIRGQPLLNSLKVRRVGWRILAYIALIGYLLWFVFPMLWMMITSVKKPLDSFAIPPVWFFEPVLDHYEYIFSVQPIQRNLVNSLIVATGTTVISVSLGALAAYGLAKLRVPGRQHFIFGFFAQRILPLIAIAVPIYLLFRSLNLLNNTFGLVIAHTAFNLPFTVFLMISFFEDIPQELEESAWIDGCSRLGAFFRVSLPLAAPGLAVVAIFCMVYSWNEFMLALLLTGPDTKTLPIQLMGFMNPSGREGLNWGPMTAMSTVMTLPVFVFTLMTQRYLVRGLTLGALK